MIDLAFVESLIRALDGSSLDHLELERGGTRILLSKSPRGGHSGGQAQMAVPMAPGVGPTAYAVEAGEVHQPGMAAPDFQGGDGESPEAGFLEVTSPMVGTYYSAPAPDADPYVEVGQRIGNGTVLCIIEAMKLMNELESEVEGTIAKVMVENAQPVEYGQVLFLIDPS